MAGTNRPTPPGIRELQARTEAFLKRTPTPEQGVGPESVVSGGAPQWFSHFLPRDAQQVFNLVDRFMSIADANPGRAGLDAVLASADEATATLPLDMVKHALMIFITHSKQATRLPIPPLEERQPEKLRPSQQPQEGGIILEGAVGAEAQLDWFREDPWANAHHEHWHVVYPFSGIPDGMGNASLKDRQGELFVYMHEQMLARYDTERLAVGLPAVVPFSKYTDSIPEAYNPNVAGYAPRPAGLRLANVNRPDYGFQAKVSTETLARNRLDEAILAGAFRNGAPQNTLPITPDLIGATQEASIGSANNAFYGSHHNLGHMLIAFVADPTGSHGGTPPGVMSDTATAIRDPIFFRWHRHVDTFSFNWQEAQPPNDFSDAPNVLIRKSLGGGAVGNASPDIILCFKDKIPNSASAGFDGDAFGAQQFGGANWSSAFASGGFATDTLETSMFQATFQSDGGPITVNYLDQREFYYFIRVQNLDSAEKEVTVRIFLAAAQEPWVSNRRNWIEMDKFRTTLAAGGPNTPGTVLSRSSAMSSVIRKPGTKPPSAIGRTGNDTAEEYCECGWPYNLLLPRGTTAGMPFRLFVMLTDWALDDVDDHSACGSMSYCGARDRYPDKRTMGYPFNLPFPGGSIANTVAAQNNMAMRDIKIKLVDTFSP